MPSSFFSFSPRVWLAVITVFVFAIGAVFFYGTQRNKENLLPPVHTQDQQEEEQEETEQPFVWEEQQEKVRQLIAVALPECTQGVAPTGEIIGKADLTGDGVEEAMITTGCTGAYTSHMALFRAVQGEPVFARFIGEDGQQYDERVFLSGASLQTYTHFGMMPEFQLVYQANGSALPFECRVNWTVLPFQWDEARQMFVYDASLVSVVRTSNRDQFPPYFDPITGPTHEPVEDCGLFYEPQQEQEEEN